MGNPIILVTGASGKTGTPTVEQLIERGHTVRALVRQIDARSNRLAELGAEVVVGDFLDLQSLRDAVRGVQSVYFCYPPADRLVEATSNIAIAARDEGIKGLVNMSQITAREVAESHLAFQHWQSEQVLDWADIGASHIRPTFFAEDLHLFTGASIAAEGKIYLPFGAEKHAPVTAEDIARVVVGILEDPAQHVGKRYVVTGPQNLTITEMAEVLTQELGRVIEYVDLPVDHWRGALIEQVSFPAFLADHLAAVAKDHQNGVFSAVTDVVERIGGQPATPLREFVQRNRQEFSAHSKAA